MATGNDIDATQPPLLDLREGATVLWKRRLLIGASVLAFVAAAGLYLGVTPLTYTASASLIVDPRQPRTTETDNVLPGIGSDSAAIASQVAVIGSRDLLRMVFDDQQLAAEPEFNSAGLLGGTPGPAAVFERFLAGVSVEREGLTYVLDVSYSAHDPELAARIVNAIVDRYVAGQVAQKSAANAEVSDLLSARIAKLEQDVLEAERAVEAYKATHRIYDSGTGTTLIQAQIDQLNVQLQAAQETARQAESRYEQAVAAGRTPRGLISLTEMLSSPSAEKLRDDYNAKSTALASAQITLGSRHPTIVKMTAELRQVEALMVKEVERITAEFKGQADVARGIVDKISADIAQLREQANAANVAAIELRQLERNADASRQVLEQFQKRSEETRQFQNLQIADVRVIAAATAPLRPTWPKPPLVLGVAGALGLMVGAGAALMLGAPKPKQERRRPAPRPRRSLAEMLAPVLAAVRRPQRPRLTTSAPVTAPAFATAAEITATFAGIERAARPRPAAPAAPREPRTETVPAEAMGRAPPVPPRTSADDVRAAIAELKRSRSYAELN